MHTHTHAQTESDPHYLLGVVPVFIPPAAERRFVKSLLEKETLSTTEADRDPDSLPHCLKGKGSDSELQVCRRCTKHFPLFKYAPPSVFTHTICFCFFSRQLERKHRGLHKPFKKVASSRTGVI